MRVNMETVARYALYFFFYSAAGWFFESCYCSVKPKKWINRGFLTGPLCPIYGTGALVFLVCVEPLRRLYLSVPVFGKEISFTIPVVFFAGLVLADIVEFTVSLVMEKLFHARWWDYSDRFLNIQGRICFKHSLYWGASSVLFLYVLHPFIDKYFSLLSAHAVYYLLGIILFIFVFDLADAVVKALDVRKLMDKLDVMTGSVSALAGTLVENAVALSFDEFAFLFEKFANLKADGAKQFADIKAHFERLSRYGFKGKKKNTMFMKFPRIKEYANQQIENIETQAEKIKDSISKYASKK